MRLLYWFVKLGWYFIMTFLATTYWKGFGWWFLIICAILLILGDEWIRKLLKK
ncbi:hypothetical protein [Bacillus sp. Marseille-P3661]|uniref:hypothetical protein n=1 Tax=Bacillus sp. Marseille-P3661 TaxID=1936234 RepID=UPI0015E1B5B2|nr:hypothetical protein [Bacillus sp. Marseille-P3661]